MQTFPTSILTHSRDIYKYFTMSICKYALLLYRSMGIYALIISPSLGKFSIIIEMTYYKYKKDFMLSPRSSMFINMPISPSNTIYKCLLVCVFMYV